MPEGKEAVDEIAFMADRVNGGSFYPVTDHLGSVVALQQKNVSSMAEAFHYTAYGEIAAGEESGYPFRFTGRRYDAETGLYYYRARYYNPILGRFYQTDPRAGARPPARDDRASGGRA